MIHTDVFWDFWSRAVFSSYPQPRWFTNTFSQRGSKWLENTYILVPATEGHTAPETQRQSVIVTGSSNGTMMHSKINRWLLLKLLKNTPPLVSVAYQFVSVRVSCVSVTSNVLRFSWSGHPKNIFYFLYSRIIIYLPENTTAAPRTIICNL